jgi:protein-S-isoprenylcysteine O-methyltransferase Ste14/pimeloyl-ACP methyl ester carboxylesterase
MTRALASAAFALLALPGVVAGAIPFVLVRLFDRDAAFHAAGLAGLVPGVLLIGWCVREFFVAGRGTLAPWDPPRRLVTTGPYRYSRNPMYVAVGLMLVGWAIAFRTPWLWVYAVGILVAFHVRVVRHEEPRLLRTFREEWTRYARHVPRWLALRRGSTRPAARRAPARWGRRIAVAALALLVAAAISGLMYEAFAEGRDARDFPAPGERVDIGGRHLHLVCLGEGEPTVILHPGAWETAVDARDVRERVAARTRVCSYDPRGRGWSDPGPGNATVTDLTNDLAVLQDRAALRGPFVLVGTSVGGLTIEMFARLFPERTGGLVFVDAASHESLPLVAARAAEMSGPACRNRVLAYLGVTRLLDPLDLRREPEENARPIAMHYTAAAWSGLCAMARGLRDSREAFDGAPALDPDLPITVLSASAGDDRSFGRYDWITEAMRPAFVESHRRLAEQSSAGAWEVVAESGHRIAEDQPEAVTDAVLAMVEQARAIRPRPRP